MFFIRKRIIGIFLAFLLILGLLDLRLVHIYKSKPYSKVASQGKSKTITIASSRGYIYDRKGKSLVNEDKKYFAVLKPNIASVGMLGNVLDQEEMADLFLEITKEQPLLVSLPKPLAEAENIKVLQTFDRYSKNQLAKHLIGYLDSSKDEGLAGIEKGFNELLQYGSGRVSATFTVNGFGRVLEGEEIIIKKENFNSPAGIGLTIDKEIQKITENAMVKGGIDKGAALVLDAKTSAILSMASLPDFDPDDLAKSLNSPDSPFINRALTPYPVGSVYKPLVASAGIANEIYNDYEYTCTGSIRVADVVFNCHNRTGHGKIDMDTAIALSCNCYFVHLASLIGKDSILKLSQDLGLGRQIDLAPGIISAPGILPKDKDFINPGELANLSFGQGRFLATPLQIAALYACYANNGVYNEPYLLQNQIDNSGEIFANFIPPEGKRVMSMHIAELTKQMLKETVTRGSGMNAKPDKCDAAGKTATAQSGRFKNGKELMDTWFAGFFPADDPQFVIVVMKEGGRSPILDCIPVFKEIADKILDL